VIILQLDNGGSIAGEGSEGSFFSPPLPDWHWGPLSLLVNGYRSFLPQEREADHSPSSAVGVNNAWSCISIPPYVFMVWWYVVEYGNNSDFVTDDSISRLLLLYETELINSGEVLKTLPVELTAARLSLNKRVVNRQPTTGTDLDSLITGFFNNAFQLLCWSVLTLYVYWAKP